MNSLIPCAKKCRFQKDGYCNLENISISNNLIQNRECIYFSPIEYGEGKKSVNKEY